MTPRGRPATGVQRALKRGLHMLITINLETSMAGFSHNDEICVGETVALLLPWLATLVDKGT